MIIQRNDRLCGKSPVEQIRRVLDDNSKKRQVMWVQWNR